LGERKLRKEEGSLTHRRKGGGRSLRMFEVKGGAVILYIL
jgi:hypothetical protein